MVTKVAVARGLTAAYLTGSYIRQMDDNYRKGNWVEAGKDTAFFSLAIAPVVAPNLFFGSIVYPVAVGVGVGLAATAVVLEATGLGDTQDVADLLYDPPSPVEWYQTVVPEVKRELKETAAQAQNMLEGVARVVEGEVIRRYNVLEKNVKESWEFVNRYGQWQNPILLPF